MIGRLRGIVEYTLDDTLILDVGGVGYTVFTSGLTRSQLPENGNEAILFIETHVREDHIHLFGFASAEEKAWFNLLVSVNGVGPKMGLNILSAMEPNAVNLALAASDKTAFTQISGVGPKLAARLITELKDKAPDLGGEVVTLNTNKTNPSNSTINDATAALVNLGFGKSEAYATLGKIATEKPDAGVEDLIRLGLSELSAA